MNKMQTDGSAVAARALSLADAIESATGRLAAAGIPRARFEAMLLMESAIGLGRECLLAEPARALTQEETARLEALVERRAQREPMAQIRGMREFWSLDFAVSRATLIPRPESETLIEGALERVADRNAALRILDLGTGSGCLLLALLAELPRASGLGIDKSEAACGIARDNARRLGLEARARFQTADWTAPGFGDEIRAAASHMKNEAETHAGAVVRFDLAISNPPYVADAEIEALEPEVRDYEPRAALAGGSDGLDAYRALAPLVPALLAPKAVALFEIGAGQGREVEAIMRASGLGSTGVWRDLAGIERCLGFASP
ncbi:MAG TPA: peptide chain release factor N(5)-glutamine methyltransferase [Alphaproteobacteria bacterium]|nr:peptide chain release factor N(5)-glutamine methyltransferase [Alphaproteobacteria bacterium]